MNDMEAREKEWKREREREKERPCERNIYRYEP